MEITTAQVKAISLGVGRTDICSAVAAFITEKGKDYQLDTPMRIKHFLGQCCIESNFYRSLEESLYYSVERLQAVWPKRFPTYASAVPYAKNPEKLANFTYGGRMGNDTVGDGWMYRGRSIKQITGKNNYNDFDIWIHRLFPSAPNFVRNPELLATIEWCIWPAVWYWTSKNCAYFADRDDVKGLTRNINGGLTNLLERTNATALAGKTLNMRTDPSVLYSAPKTPDPLLKEMQEKMGKLASKMARPDFDPKGADGWNGPNTEKAIKAIQTYCKLAVDGKCGPNTRRAINVLCEKYGV